MKTVLYTKSTEEFVAGPFEPQYLVDGVTPKLEEEDLVELAIIEPDKPSKFDPTTHYVDSHWVNDFEKLTRTLVYEVIEKNTQQIMDQDTIEADKVENEFNPSELKLLLKEILVNLDPNKLPQFPSLFPPWKACTDYYTGDIVQFKNVLYKANYDFYCKELEYPPLDPNRFTDLTNK